MLKQLIQEAKRPMSLSERFRVIVEIVAYAMQPPGPRGGRFYYTSKGKKVYRELGGKTGKSRKLKQLTGQSYDKAWGDLNISTHPVVRPNGAAIGRALRDIFGDKAPDPQQLSDMFSDMGIKSEVRHINIEQGKVTVSYDVKESNGSVVGEMVRQFHKDIRDKPSVYHDYFALKEEWQGGGRGAAVLGKALKAYKQLGVKKVDVTAALEAGPYAWARFGFNIKGFPGVPPEEVFASKKEQFGQFLQRLGASEEGRDKILEDVKDMHSLAGTVIRRPDPKTGKMASVKAGKDFLLHGSLRGTGQGWPGKVDLDDKKQLARWRRQVAKGRKQRKAALEAERNTVPISPEELAQIKAKRAKRVAHYKELNAAPIPKPGPSARELARRLRSRP